MISRESFSTLLANGPLLMDGATGSNLLKAGMPRGVCVEEWIFNNPEHLCNLQRAYVEAGSDIIYAPTFQANPAILRGFNLEAETENINARLVALTRSVAGQALVAGSMTTMSTCANPKNPKNFEWMISMYRRQIRGLIDGGADLIAAETLCYPEDAEAVLTAAELEGVRSCMFTFIVGTAGYLPSGDEAGKAFKQLESLGALAVGFNCVKADSCTATLTASLKAHMDGPLVCKPNAGSPTIKDDGLVEYSMGPEEFAGIVHSCWHAGASIIGGCCGTDPTFIKAVAEMLK